MKDEFKHFEKMHELTTELPKFIRSILNIRLSHTTTYHGISHDSRGTTKRLFDFEQRLPNVVLYYSYNQYSARVELEPMNTATVMGGDGYCIHVRIYNPSDSDQFIETEFVVPTKTAEDIFYCVINSTLNDFALDDIHAEIIGAFTFIDIDGTSYSIEELVSLYIEHIGFDQIKTLMDEPARNIHGFFMDVQIGTQFGLNQSYRVTIEKNPEEEYLITTEFNAGEEFEMCALNRVAKLYQVKNTYESIMKLKEVGIVDNISFQFIYG